MVLWWRVQVQYRNVQLAVLTLPVLVLSLREESLSKTSASARTQVVITRMDWITFNKVVWITMCAIQVRKSDTNLDENNLKNMVSLDIEDQLKAIKDYS